MFAQVHRLLATTLFALTATGHLLWIIGLTGARKPLSVVVVFFAFAWPTIVILILGLTHLAAWLSAIEARYWGMRLLYRVVMRAMQFHAAHYLPVGLLAVTIVWGYEFLL